MTKLWSAICPANIKILDLVFKAPQLGFLARSIQSTSSVFDGIEELKLYQYGDPGQAATSSISADLGRIIDTTRGSLRSLFLHFKERVSPDSLGYIPNLSRLQIVISEEEQHQPYRNFLKLHKDTLKHLVLKPVSTSAVHTLWYEYDPEDCPLPRFHSPTLALSQIV
ncbi:hypothetical protein BDN72DRAFT_849355 [Pluteus cervinus]|uniref:Uncharacterized protein n=1 Tax=Pluteus cervinus TaxID=181527 RepID=A0ACD3A8R8_9AGAR|nr:hypothetical protein BDN72DRAFT_849355 [Pluteus cervinus]